MGFMGQADYQAVLNHMMLSSGLLWPIPITLDVDHTTAERIQSAPRLALLDQHGLCLAVMEVSECWKVDKPAEAFAIYGTYDLAHPGVAYLFQQSGTHYIAGNVSGVQMLQHYDFQSLRFTPSALRNIFEEKKWSQIIAYQTRNPMHRAAYHVTVEAAKKTNANLLLHPAVGMTNPGDIDHYTRVRCYQKMLSYYPQENVFLSVLPIAMRMAGPREAIWHALIRKNYGCSHFIIGRDHASPGKNAKGQGFYADDAAQVLAREKQSQLGIEIVPMEEMVYDSAKKNYCTVSQVSDPNTIQRISGTEFRRRLQAEVDVPEWFSFPEVVAELRRSYPAKNQQGFTVFFTGLSGAGKTTLADALLSRLREFGGRRVSLFDGDEVRKQFSGHLGFSKEDRDSNILRMGVVAREITRHQGIVLCAFIAPYETIRQQVRQMIEQHGGFVEVYVATPLSICEARDRKGLYAKARAGEISHFTGVDDPYECPVKPDVIVDTRDNDTEKALQSILLCLKKLGYV
jgi:sulfate adenylyltransferase